MVSPFHSDTTTVLARVGLRALCLTFCLVWRELLEHLGDTLVQVLFIFLSVVGHGVLGTAAPNQLLGLRVVHVNNESSFLVVLLRGGGFTHPSESSPTPSSTHTVIEGLKCPFGM